MHVRWWAVQMQAAFGPVRTCVTLLQQPLQGTSHYSMIVIWGVDDGVLRTQVPYIFVRTSMLASFISRSRICISVTVIMFVIDSKNL